jgi:hypothetical protein
MQCVAKRKDGSRCSKHAMRDAMVCYFHARTKAEQIAMARSGGQAKAAKYRREIRCRCSECGDVHVSRKARGTIPSRSS